MLLISLQPYFQSDLAIVIHIRISCSEGNMCPHTGKQIFFSFKCGLCLPDWCHLPLSLLIIALRLYTNFCYFSKQEISGSVVKKLLASVEDVGSIPGSRRSPGGENGNPLQYSCLKKSIDSGAYWAAFHGVAFLLQGIFLTQGSNLRLLCYRQILYQLSYQELVHP